MKKFVVLLVVVAMTCFSAMAFAAEVTVGGSYEVRNRAFENTAVQLTEVDAVTSGDHRDTQNRIRIDVNAKAGEVKGKLQLESDFGGGERDWGTNANPTAPATVQGISVEKYSTAGNSLGFREAWVSFNLPFAPTVNVTGGHQLLTLGNGWFFRSMHFGSDAWVISNKTGNNTLAFVNVKAAEGVKTDTNAQAVARANDVDAYVLLDVLKLNDNNSIGVDLTLVRDRRAALSTGATAATNIYFIPGWSSAANSNPFKRVDLQNFSVNYNGKLGPVGLKVQGDIQRGTAEVVQGLADLAVGDIHFKGYEVVAQGSVALAPITLNFTVGQGSGDRETAEDVTQFVNLLDVDPHYTFLYEYKVNTAARNYAGAGEAGTAKNTGMANTRAIGVGAAVPVSKSVTVAADLWHLTAVEAVALNGAVTPGVGPAKSHELGMELDVKVNWKLYDNLAWNWTLGWMKPGAAYDRVSPYTGLNETAEDVRGIQGVLAFKF